MNRLPFLFLFVCTFLQAPAQQNNPSLLPGARLLFNQVQTRLTVAEKNSLFRQLGFVLSNDQKQFILDKDAANYPFAAQVLPTDLNKDGHEEIFIVFGNTFTSGNTGSSVVVFIQNSKGRYEQNLGFPGLVPEALATTSLGYPDLLIPGPGFEYPVWRWNGKSYTFYKQVSDQAYPNLKKNSIETISKQYTTALQQQPVP